MMVFFFYEISNRKIWEKAAKDEVGLENYFKRHKKSYAWDEPRFKGIAYHVKDAADVSAVKKVSRENHFKSGLLFYARHSIMIPLYVSV